jgi:hypothetical protein
MAAAVQLLRRPTWQSWPPERFFDLARDVAPGQPDIVKIALGPLRQFAALTEALAPDVHILAKLAKKAGNMNICH